MRPGRQKPLQAPAKPVQRAPGQARRRHQARLARAKLLARGAQLDPAFQRVERPLAIARPLQPLGLAQALGDGLLASSGLKQQLHHRPPSVHAGHVHRLRGPIGLQRPAYFPLHGQGLGQADRQARRVLVAPGLAQGANHQPGSVGVGGIGVQASAKGLDGLVALAGRLQGLGQLQARLAQRLDALLALVDARQCL
jgi:hypothetical protein